MLGRRTRIAVLSMLIAVLLIAGRHLSHRSADRQPGPDQLIGRVLQPGDRLAQQPGNASEPRSR